uniref:Uncharacterized protein LOC101494946 n=1 Tax=Cicer arietinum TaxID=3827 RepID=A0A1S2XHA6_CICAR|nr:uncharacterized protein LOC101494946 [Cicer arietinum]
MVEKYKTSDGIGSRGGELGVIRKEVFRKILPYEGQNRQGNQSFGRQLGQVIQSFRCGEERHYANACTFNNLPCYNFQKAWHFTKDFKALNVEPTMNATRVYHPTTKGCFYCMGVEAGNQSSNLIQQDCKILFMSSLPFDLVVSTPAKTLTVNSACLHYQVTFQNRDLSINLICLPLQSLEIILDTDWISHHYIILYCARKLVFFSEPRVVRYLAANKLGVSLREGTQEVLSLANVETKLDVRIDMVLVKLYPRVVPIEIPGIPPVREVVFFIDLHLGTRPISIVPYQMSPLDSNELKGQIEYLLEKGFLRPRLEIVQQTTEKVKKIKEEMKISQDR